MKKGMMISCKDATELAVRQSHEKLNRWDRFRLKFHLLMCKICGLFEKQNKDIDVIASELDDQVNEKMPDHTKQKILQKLQS
jgi:hypothetical protein